MNGRTERIEWLLRELRHEITRGIMERDIGETLQFNWSVPLSNNLPGGMVACRFVTYPTRVSEMCGDENGVEPRLRVIK